MKKEFLTRMFSTIVRCSALLIPSLLLAQIEIPEGTKVRVRLDQSLSSATAEVGQPVQFAVAEDLKINEQPALTAGASVAGTVVEAIPKRRMGRTGKLDFSIDSILAPDGSKIPVRYSIVKKEGGSHAVRTGVITAGVAVVFWPAAPFILLMHGKDTTFNKGMTFDVFTDARFTLKPKAEANAPAGAKSTLTITSVAPGSDIDLDGAFAGNTPSTLQVTAGTHQIKVTSAGKVWQRSINVQAGGAISLAATFADAPAAAPAGEKAP